MKPVKIFSSYFLSRAKVRADHQYQTDTAVNIYPDYPGSGDYSGSGYYPPTYSDHCYRLFEETEFGILVGTDPSWDRIQPYAHRAKPYDLDDNFEWCYECLKGHFPHKETDCQTNLLQTIGQTIIGLQNVDREWYQTGILNNAVTNVYIPYNEFYYFEMFAVIEPNITEVTPLSSATKAYSATCYIPSRNFGNHTLHEKPDDHKNHDDHNKDDDLHENPYLLAVLWIILLLIGLIYKILYLRKKNAVGTQTSNTSVEISESDSNPELSLQSEEFAEPDMTIDEKPKFLELDVPDIVESVIQILPDDNPPTVELKTEMIIADETLDEELLPQLIAATEKAEESEDVHSVFIEKAKRLIDTIGEKKTLKENISGKELKELENTLTRITEKGLKKRLHNEYEIGLALLTRLLKFEKMKAKVMALKQPTISEIRSYSTPKEPVRKVMICTYLLLGEQESSLKTWKNIQALMGKNGKKSLKYRISQCDPDSIPEKVARNAEKWISQLDLIVVSEASSGAATFYIWSSNAIESCLENYS